SSAGSAGGGRAAPGAVDGGAEPAGAAAATAGAGVRSSDRGSAALRGEGPRLPGFRARPADPEAVSRARSGQQSGVSPGDLPPFPEIADDTPVEEVLLLLGRQLELLYGAVSGTGAAPESGGAASGADSAGGGP
ncbi:MAG: hypothetical protein MI919_03845, partial [Holophagales bacterium]|nr:hypothetical protein [Holophagales bacterium]